VAEQVSPTRSNLLAKRAQRRLALQGVDLLKRKRDALIAEFFSLVRRSLEARLALNQAAQQAYLKLILAKGLDSPEAVEAIAAGGGEVPVELEVESIYGVRVPRLSAQGALGLDFSPIGVGARTLEASREFQALAQAILEVANTENRLRRIGEEIKKTNRRVNALEQITVPTINAQIKQISDTLDQRALEEVTTLKRIKRKLEARQKA
jgi:V/A-type H+-transporting ATPase subunit D